MISQISAGEVVERPSGLIKELVENSLDAGATEIEVHFSQGGKTLSVRDNGCGMTSTSLPIALQRHTTSKIIDSKDLWSLCSYGFRGEALASISAVSALTVTSRPEGQPQAAQQASIFGKCGEVKMLSGSAGTTVHMERLFENVPARYKFLKSEASETSQIKNTLKAMANVSAPCDISSASGFQIDFSMACL